MFRKTLACAIGATLLGTSVVSAQVGGPPHLSTSGFPNANPPQNPVGPDVFNYIVANEDGTYEDSIGITGAGTYDIIWMNRFAVSGGNNLITSVQGAISSSTDPNAALLNGRPLSILIYSDATAAGAEDAVLLSTFNTTVANSGTGILNNYNIPDTVVPTANFWVAMLMKNNNNNIDFPASQDQTDPDTALTSWTGFVTPGNTLNEANLASIPAGQRNFIDTFGLPGNWGIRAVGDVIPEPASLGLLAAGGLFLMRRRG